MLSGLRGTIAPREALTEAQRAQMLALMQLCYAGVSAERFARDLAEKQYVILLFVRRTGELAGFSTLRVAEELLDGRPVEVTYSGDTVIHPDWWGQKELQVQFARFMMSRKLRRPLSPMLWLLLSGGYKTYLLAVNNFPRTVPRYDWEAPPERVAFLRTVATRWFGAQYDAERGTLRFEGKHYRVRDGIAPIDREARAHPHIAFFAEHNPGHVEGEELVCLVEIRVADLAHSVGRIVWKQLRGWTRRGLRVLGVGAGA
jgi:hypothetical protein